MKTEQEYIEIVRKDGLELRNIENQTEAICLEAVRQNGFALEYVKDELQTEAICLEAISKLCLALQYIGEQKLDICSSNLHKYTNGLDLSEFMYHVGRSGLCLKYVKTQTKTICLAAVSMYGLALKYVKDELQTEDVCLEAVRQNWPALQYVKDEFQTEAICLEAVNQDKFSIFLVKKEFQGIFMKELESIKD